MQRAPRILGGLAQFCGWTGRQQQTLWHALARARWTESVEFRNVLLMDETTIGKLSYGAAYAHGRHFLETVCTPVVLVKTIEALHQERLLSRQDATGLQNSVLDASNSRGAWCDHVLPRQRS